MTKITKTEEIAKGLYDCGYIRQCLERHTWGQGKVSHSMIVDKLMDWIGKGMDQDGI
jgi:hypothetical protein